MIQQPYYNQGYNTMPYSSNPYLKTIDNNNNVIWVDGEIGAKSYPLYGANNGVILMDREEEDIVYIKTTDTQGKPNTQRYKLVKAETPNTSATSLTEYVRKDELEELLKTYLQPATQIREGTQDEQTTGTTTIVRKTITK